MSLNQNDSKYYFNTKVILTGATDSSESNTKNENAMLSMYRLDETMEYISGGTSPSFGLSSYMNPSRQIVSTPASIPSSAELLDFGSCNSDDLFYVPSSLGKSLSAAQNKKGKREQQGSQKPKRPLSAYNFFFHYERAKMLEHMPTRAAGKPRRSHGKIGFADLARNIASKWKSISADERKQFDDKAVADKERYVKDMEEWKKVQLMEVAQAAVMIAPNSHQFISIGQTPSVFQAYKNTGFFPSPSAITRTCNASCQLQPERRLLTAASCIKDSHTAGDNFSGAWNHSSADPAFTVSEAYALNRAQRTHQRISAALNVANDFNHDVNSDLHDIVDANQYSSPFLNRFTRSDGASTVKQQHYEGNRDLKPQERRPNQLTPSSPQILELATQLDDESTQLLLNIFR